MRKYILEHIEQVLGGCMHSSMIPCLKELVDIQADAWNVNYGYYRNNNNINNSNNNNNNCYYNKLMYKNVNNSNCYYYYY